MMKLSVIDQVLDCLGHIAAEVVVWLSGMVVADC